MVGDKLLPGTKPGFLKSEKCFSDLRKPGLVPGKSLSPNTNINSVLEKSKKWNFSIDLIDLKLQMTAI